MYSQVNFKCTHQLFSYLTAHVAMKSRLSFSCLHERVQPRYHWRTMHVGKKILTITPHVRSVASINRPVAQIAGLCSDAGRCARAKNRSSTEHAPRAAHGAQ